MRKSYYERIREGLETFMEEEIELFVKERFNDYMLYLDVLSFKFSISGPISSSTIENPANLFPYTNEIQWGSLKAGDGHCLEEKVEQFYLENPKNFYIDFSEYFESLFDDCIESYKSKVVNDPKQFSEFLIEECNFEIIERSKEQIDVILKLGELYDIDLSEFEPTFSEVLYKKSLEFSKIKDADFCWEGNQLNKSIEITLNF